MMAEFPNVMIRHTNGKSKAPEKESMMRKNHLNSLNQCINRFHNILFLESTKQITTLCMKVSSHD